MKYDSTYQVNGVVVEERVSGDMLDPRTGLIDDGTARLVEARKLHLDDFCARHKKFAQKMQCKRFRRQKYRVVHLIMDNI